MTRIEKAVHTICSYAIIPCAAALLILVFVFVIYIVGRLFNLPWLFVEEYTGYWLVFVAYIPLAYGLTTEVHIRMDIVVKRLPEKARSILQVCTEAMALFIACYLMGRSIEWVIHGVTYDLHSQTTFYTLLWPTYLPVSIGFALLALALMVKLARRVMDLMELMRAKSG